MAIDPIRDQGPDPLSGRGSGESDETDEESERDAEEDVLEEDDA